MGQSRLSERNMWDSMYETQLDPRWWPYPEERCSAYEMVEAFKKYLPQQDGIRLIEMG